MTNSAKLKKSLQNPRCAFCNRGISSDPVTSYKFKSFELIPPGEKAHAKCIKKLSKDLKKIRKANQVKTN